MNKDSWRPALDEYERSLTVAADECARFLADARAQAKERPAGTCRDGRWLTLGGVCGCGKTERLALPTFKAASEFNPGAAALWVNGTGVYMERNRRPQCVWLTATAMADRMRRGEYDLPEYLGHDYLVAIDDVGAARDTTSFIAEALYRLCNVRLGKWTIFTTNLSLAEVAKQIDPRVASRMIRDRNVAVSITAGDYAMRAKR